VHRIDRETSGVLLLAKTAKGHQCLKEQFQKREVEKIYHVFVYGNIKNDSGTIDYEIGRKVGNFRKWSAEGDVRGQIREALTEYRVLKRMGDEKATFVEARPKTGRTHQIRVHFRSIGHPVVCDKLYAPHRQTILGFERLALHARAITFKNPHGETISIEAPYPNDFRNALDFLN
jgi:23S rRNA pseudouridine1911/1915/1917 synthase